jgi:hypothetical protein
MLYPCSPNLQSLPMPGIGFCQNIFIDQYALDRVCCQVRPLTPERVPASAGRATQTPTDPPAIGYRLQ